MRCSRHAVQGPLVFWYQLSYHRSLAMASNETAVGKKGKKCKVSINKSLYLRNDRRHRVTIFRLFAAPFPHLASAARCGPHPRNPWLRLCTLNISETVRDYRHSFNWILIGTFTRPTQQCHLEWSCVTMSDLAKCSMARSVVRSLCDSRASCFNLVPRNGIFDAFCMAPYYKLKRLAIARSTL